MKTKKAANISVKKPMKPKPAGFAARLSNPLFPVLVLILITFIVYFRTLFLDYTKLDDSIFIIENAHYNSDAKNINVSFHRGLFNPTRDAYYRPLFLVDFIIESRIFGTHPAGYHFTNLLYHILSVILLFLFLKKIKIPPLDSLLLSLLFALHPVLTQAVAWIPGRNDMILMIFFLSSFILLLQYLEKQASIILLPHSMLFLAALFTKETAIIIPVIIAGFSVFYLKCGWRKLLAPALTWILAIGIFLIVRSTAPLSKDWISPLEMIHTGFDRMGVVLQYLGKIFLPVNLTVFPIAGDISLIWGILALAGLTALIIYSKSYKRPLTYLGLFWFIVFLIPVLIVPKSLNDQVFEHRLYLPMIGILIILSQAFPFKGALKTELKITIITVIVLVFAVQSFVRTGYFKDPLTFWTHAVQGSPHSGYAHYLLGTKVADSTQRETLFKQASALDPTIKNLNYYLGEIMFNKNKPDSAEFYLRMELKHNPVPDAYFILARIAFARNSLDSAAVNLEKVISLDPLNPQANHNLALLYYQQGHIEKTRQVVHSMQIKGVVIGNDLLRLVNGK